MNSANDIREELKQLNSRLADMPRTMPYKVPAGYFDGFVAGVIDYIQIAEANEPALNISKEMPYTAPDGYFDNLAHKVLMQVKEPALPLTKELPYIVPEGYFDNLAERFLANAKQAEQPKGKVIALNGNVWKSIRWAAAALLVSGIGLGAYSYLNRDKTINTQEQLALIPKDSIDEYVQLHIDEFDMEAIAATLEPKDVTSLTDKLSEEEIKNYLNETGWDETTMNL